MRIVADGDIVDVESREVNNIVSEFYEDKQMAEDPGGTIGDDEWNYVPAAVTDGESELTEVNLLEMEKIEGMVTIKAEHYSVRDENFNCVNKDMEWFEWHGSYCVPRRIHPVKNGNRDEINYI